MGRAGTDPDGLVSYGPHIARYAGIAREILGGTQTPVAPSAPVRASRLQRQTGLTGAN